MLAIKENEEVGKEVLILQHKKVILKMKRMKRMIPMKVAEVLKKNLKTKTEIRKNKKKKRKTVTKTANRQLRVKVTIHRL